MKRKNTLKKCFSVFIVMSVFIFCAPLHAETSAVDVISVTPANPSPGDLLTVVFSYCAAAYDQTCLILAISDSVYTTIQADNTGGQTFKVNLASMDIGGTGPGSAASANKGYEMLDSQTVAHCQNITWNVHLPNTYLEGTTYNVIVAGRAYDCRPGSIASQDYFSITTPPPGTGCSITKTAEISPVRPGDYVLYTIDYNYANANSPAVTDTVPLHSTLISQSIGGTNGGTAAGSGLTWAFANTLSRKVGKVWFIVRIDPAAPYSTAISNIAGWSIINPSTLATLTGNSNDAVVTTTAAPSPFVKTQIPASPGSANLTDIITYSMDFHAGGETFHSYDPFDANISGFHDNGVGGIWNWYDTGAGTGGGIDSPSQPAYAHYLRDTPADFCFGEIQGDVYIMNGTDNDGHIVFRDSGTPNAPAYGIGISPDGGGGASGGANMWLQKCAAGCTNFAAVSPPAISLNTWYTIKILVTDAGNLGNDWIRIQAKCWTRGTTEPAAWMLDVTDSSGVPQPCGYVGFQGNRNNPNQYDNLKISRTIQSYPVVYDSVPATITYTGGSAANADHSAAVYAGGMVSWDIFTSFTDKAYSLTWTGTASSCGDAYNTAHLDIIEAAPIDSNTTTLNMNCSSPTNTPSPLPTNTNSPTFTRTASPTGTPTFTATPTATRTNTPVLYPTLVFVKSAAPNPAREGETVNYTITYSNTGPVDATNVIIIDLLDTNLTYVPASGGTHNGTNPGGEINWLMTNIPAAGTGTISFSAVVASNLTNGTVIQNQTSATCLESATLVLSNLHILNLDIPILKLTPVVNVPNPVVDQTDIIFNLSVSAEVTIKFYTISGEPIRTFKPAEVTAQLQPSALAGTYTPAGDNRVRWDCRNKSGNPVASGVYFFRVEAKKGSENASYISKLAVLR